MKKIIAVSGEIAAGKGVASAYIAEKYGAKNIRSSDVFRRVLDMLHIAQSRETVSEMSRVLRLGFGEDVAIETILKDMRTGDDEIFVIEGLRRKEEIKAVRASGVESLVLFLTVDMRTRYKRVVERAENVGDAEKTFEEFQNNATLNAESTHDEVKERADTVIPNDGTLEDLHAALDDALEEFLN